jgi:pimeloyl-ACP methyl ester carboxylesterase
VARVALCSSLSPLWPPHRTPGISLRSGLALRFLARAPRASAALGDAILPLIRRHPGLVSRMIAVHAAADERPLLREPAERRAATTSFLEAASGGVRGMVDDYLTCARHWGFAPAEIDAEVHLWHGLTDRLIRIDDALALAASLPRCAVFVDPDEGHHFFRRRLAEILATLVDGQSQRSAPTTLTAKSAA